jgi:hypothetical protein
MAGLVIGLLLAGGPVLAEDGHRSREQREARARTACAAGRVDEGVEMLARLLTEFRHPNYIFNQARCYQQNGLLEQALTRFQEYLRVAADVSAEERARAERYADEVSAQLSARQAQASPPAVEKPAPEPTPVVEPPPAEVRVVAAPPPAPPPPSPRFRNTAIVLGVVAVVASAGGVAASLRIQSLQRSVESAAPASVSPGELSDRRRQAHAFETLQWIGYGVGGAALVGSLVFMMMGHDGGDRTAALGLGAVAGRPALTFSGAF